MGKLKIDLDILEKIWNGECNVSENCFPRNKAYQVAVKNSELLHAKIIKNIEENTEALLEKYLTELHHIIEMQNKEAFKKGFSMAISIIMESTDGIISDMEE